ncbi:MAG: hypothetical protein QF773_01950, partial [Lentisphaeria bacterium]|nr:hypothetical protein [Lentisphaeria bacterium]
LDEIAAGYAAETVAAENDCVPNDAEVQERSHDWRYAWNLVTAEETASWLAARFVGLEDLSTYILHQVCRELDPAPLVPTPTVANDLLPLLWPHAVFSGGLANYTTALIYRVLACTCTETTAGTLLSPDFSDSWFLNADTVDKYARLDAGYRQCAIATADDAECRRHLPELRRHFLSFRLAGATFPRREAAREALLCTTADGEPLSAVCERSNGRYTEFTAHADELAAIDAQRLFSAMPGEYVGPIAAADGYQAVELLEKIEPAPDDPVVLCHIRDRLVRNHLAPLVDTHVEYLIDLQ